MPITTPEIGTTYGSVDSDAFVDGAPYSAHILRPIIRGRNRLVAKGHEAFNLVWPVREQVVDEGTDSYPFNVIVPPFWARFHPPIEVEKKPGLTELNVGLTAGVLNSYDVQFQVCTRAQPFRLTGAFDEITADGDNDFDSYNLAPVPCSPDGYEVIEIWFRAIPDNSDLVSTGTVGTPNTSSSSAMVITPEQVILSSANWNAVASGNTHLAENGTAVIFNGPVGPVTYPRLVVDVDTDRFWFGPTLDLNELADARLTHDFDLVQLPRMIVANIMGYYSDRTV